MLDLGIDRIDKRSLHAGTSHACLLAAGTLARFNSGDPLEFLCILEGLVHAITPVLRPSDIEKSQASDALSAAAISQKKFKSIISYGIDK